MVISVTKLYKMKKATYILKRFKQINYGGDGPGGCMHPKL